MKWAAALWVLLFLMGVINWLNDEDRFQSGRMDVLRDCALDGQVVVNDRVYTCVAIPIGAAVPEQPKKPTVNQNDV
jgi:hypothetical protein